MTVARAAVLYRPNEPLIIEDLELPPLGRGQVLVKIAYSGVCGSQLMEVTGSRGPDPYLPHLLGHEASGVVVETGEGVTKVSAGERVVLTWIKGEGLDVAGPKYRKGEVVVNSGSVTTFSDFTIVAENRCVPLRADVPLDVASLFGCALLTGAGIVLNSLRPQPESTILVWGAGGIGMSAIMAASWLGCRRIIVVDTERSKLEVARQCGATDLLQAGIDHDPVSAVLALTGGSGVDFAVEAAGRASTVEQAFRCVRKKGGVCIFASHPPADQRICLDPFDLISGREIRGSWGGESVPDRDIPMLARIYEEGKLPLDKLITHRFPFSQVNDALDALAGRQVGRALLVMDETLDG